MLKDYTDACAVPQVLVAVDTADKKLLAPDMADRHFSLCIDHHPSNTLYADEVLLSEQAPATAELMTELIGLLGVPLTPLMADCLFTGLVTDTGCFRYSSVTAHTLRTAARLMDGGAQAYEINRRMFETKTRDVYKRQRWRCRRFSTARWRLRRCPGRRAPAPRLPSAPTTRTWTR